MSINLFSPSPLSNFHFLFSPPSLFTRLTTPLQASSTSSSNNGPKRRGRPKGKTNNTSSKPMKPKGSSQNSVSENGSGSKSDIDHLFNENDDDLECHGRPRGESNTSSKPMKSKGPSQDPVSENGSGSKPDIDHLFNDNDEDMNFRGRPKGKGNTSSKPKTPKGSSQNPVSENGSVSKSDIDHLFDDIDDNDMDFPFLDPPLVCCFGAVKKEFLPSVRVADHRMDPDIYSEWKMLQWKPPEFARAPGGSPSNVAISHVRLGGRAEFMGKVGRDEFGDEMVYMMNIERVQTRAVKFDPVAKTGCCYMKVKFDDGDDGKLRMESVRDAAEDSFLPSDLTLAVLKEARIFHFNSEVMISPSMRPTLFTAINLSKKFGGQVFFDLNLPLPLWKSRDETREVIKQAWEEADIIEVSREELEFLLDEDYYEKKRNYRPQYYADNYDDTKNRREYYHYTPEEVSPLWHDKLKFLFVTDGTLRIHYYTPSFDGVVVGTEDVLITPFTCDRTGSGDAVVAAIMRKLTICPEMYGDQDVLERQLRFAVAAGIISQWTIGAVRGFPTESATQNLKEQVYVPSMW